VRWLARGAAGLGLAFVALVSAALYLAASDPPRIEEPVDVFGFAGLERSAGAALPAVQRYTARDGARLAYRFYDAAAERVLVFVHGSSYHGGGYHALASHLSRAGVAKVATPNLRGHHLSGQRRGDVDYIGQLEDDLADLIASLRGDGLAGPISLGGHSSGGGLVIRFAGGAHRELASSFLLLSPVVPTSPAIRGGTAGGWASLHRKRLFGLLLLNALGVHGLDGLPVIEFNKPEAYWDGSETLAYSHRLNASYHPRFDHAKDIAALQRAPLLVLVGEHDEAVDPSALRALFAGDRPETEVVILPGIDHFGAFSDPAALERIASWLGAR
jgi:alpha-beta hydrolase superfamily lysophospholipase